MGTKQITYTSRGAGKTPYVFVTLGVGYNAAGGYDYGSIVVSTSETYANIRVFSSVARTVEMPVMVLLIWN